MVHTRIFHNRVADYFEWMLKQLLSTLDELRLAALSLLHRTWVEMAKEVRSVDNPGITVGVGDHEQ